MRRPESHVRVFDAPEALEVLVCHQAQLFDQDKDGRVSFDEARALICKSLRCGCLSSLGFVREGRLA